MNQISWGFTFLGDYLGLYTVGHAWGLFSYLDVNWNVLQGWYIFTYSLECLTPFFACREYVYLVQFDYATSIKPFNTKPGYWKICVNNMLAKSALLLDRDDVKLDLMLVWTKNNIFPPFLPLSRKFWQSRWWRLQMVTYWSVLRNMKIHTETFYKAEWPLPCRLPTLYRFCVCWRLSWFIKDTSHYACYQDWCWWTWLLHFSWPN